MNTLESAKLEVFKGTSKKYLVYHARQGNDVNGNPLYILNFFYEYSETSLYNVNKDIADKNHLRLDKWGNIKITSYNLNSDIQMYLATIQ